MERVKNAIKRFGIPNTTITVFLIILFIWSFFLDIEWHKTIYDMTLRFAMNAVMVLAMVPMIQSGTGLNFGLPVGLVGGLLGAAVSLELNLKGLPGFLAAAGMSGFFGGFFGYLYGQILNRVKGDEMVIATYVGFAWVSFWNILWLVLPFHNPQSVMGFAGQGLRTTIQLDDYWKWALQPVVKDASGVIHGTWANWHIYKSLYFPFGMVLFFAVLAFMVWLFFRTKTGTAMTAAGSNPDYARAAGINVNRMRLMSVVLSSAIGAIGINVYQMSFGFLQMYNTPLDFAFPTVAAILIGGASLNKASIGNVILGTFLFQSVLTLTPSVINTAIKLDISDVLRLIVTYGLILFALTRKGAK